MRRHDPAGEPLPPTAHVFGDACGERVRTYRDEWARTCAAAGIVGLQFRDLRRTFRSELLETPGVILHHVRDALGHADIKTTSIYLSTTLKGLEDVIRRREAAPVSHTIRTRTPQTHRTNDAPAESAEAAANLLN